MQAILELLGAIATAFPDPPDDAELRAIDFLCAKIHHDISVIFEVEGLTNENFCTAKNDAWNTANEIMDEFDELFAREEGGEEGDGDGDGAGGEADASSQESSLEPGDSVSSNGFGDDAASYLSDASTLVDSDQEEEEEDEDFGDSDS